MPRHREKPNIQNFSYYATAIIIFIGIAILIPSDLQVNFWSRDLPPLTGQMKMIYNILIIALCVQAWWERPPAGDSPLQAPDLFAYSNELFYTPQGLFAFFPVPWSLSLIRTLRNMLVVVWICSTVGLFSTVSAPLTGILFFILHGYLVGVKGTNHRWYVAVYALLILGFAETAEFSLDNYLHSVFPNWPFYFKGVSYQLWGASVRKFTAFGGMLTLFGGALAKLRNGGGWRWGDGKTLQFYCSREEGIWDGLRKFTVNNRWFAAILGMGSLVLEAAAILVLFNDNIRTLLFIGALGMHIGIYFVMYPSYGPQSVTYFLCISWGYSALAPTVPASFGLTIWCRIITVIVLTFLLMAYHMFEWWPYTGVPMYSFNRTGYDQKYLMDEKQAREIATEYMLSWYPWPIAWAKDWIMLRVTPEGGKPLEVPYSVLEKGRKFAPKHLRRICHRVGAIDILNKKGEDISEKFNTPKSTAKQFLDILATHYQKYAREWLDKQTAPPKLELIVNLKKGPLVLASTNIPLEKFNGTPTHLGLWVSNLKVPGAYGEDDNKKKND